MPSDYTDKLRQRLEDRHFVCMVTACWWWIARNSRNGYGRISVYGKERQAHRVMYELECGPIANGLVLDHLCLNRYCINPHHLEPVSKRINTLRGSSPIALKFREASA